MYHYKRVDNIYTITYKCPFTKQETTGEDNTFDGALDKLLDAVEAKMLKDIAS